MDKLLVAPFGAPRTDRSSALFLIGIGRYLPAWGPELRKEIEIAQSIHLDPALGQVGNTMVPR